MSLMNPETVRRLLMKGLFLSIAYPLVTFPSCQHDEVGSQAELLIAFPSPELPRSGSGVDALHPLS